MYNIGIDLGGTNIAAGIVDKKGKLLSKTSVKTEAEKGFLNIIAKMGETIHTLLAENNLSLSQIDGIGIGAPGSIDSKNNVIIYSNNIELENAKMGEELRKIIDKPIFISNDANCAALGESISGAAAGHKDVVMITLGTGVGGGVIIGGKIFDGSNSVGAELGHTMLVLDGEDCTCGRKGCWEAYASATALINQTKKAILQNINSLMNELIEGDINNVSGRTAFDAAKQGDKVASEVVHTYLRYVSEGIVDMINIFRPEIVLIGGGISNEGDYILEFIQNYVDNHAYGHSFVKSPKVLCANLKNDAGIIGAGMLVL